MYKKHVLFGLIIIILLFSSCKNSVTNNNELSNISQKSTDNEINIEKLSVDFSDNDQEYRIINSFWYDNNDILFCLRRMGEHKESYIYHYNLSSETNNKIYDGQFDLNIDNTLVIIDTEIGIQNYTGVVTFNPQTKELIEEILPRKETTWITTSYSRDMQYRLELNNDTIYLFNNTTNESQKINDSIGYDNMFFWSYDNTYFGYVSGYINIRLFNTESLEEIIFAGGVNFSLPEGFVDISSCKFIDNNNILVGMLCENNSYYLIIDVNGNKINSFYIDRGNNSTILDNYDNKIYYISDVNKERKLMCYDYINDITTHLYSTSAYIHCGKVSPNGESILFDQYLNDTQEFYIAHFNN